MIDRLKTLAALPSQLELVWRLFLDPRVSIASKAVAVGAILLILSPLDVLDWIPFVGGPGSLALFALVLRSFIDAAPEDVREEHEQALSAQRQLRG